MICSTILQTNVKQKNQAVQRSSKIIVKLSHFTGISSNNKTFEIHIFLIDGKLSDCRIVYDLEKNNCVCITKVQQQFPFNACITKYKTYIYPIKSKKNALQSSFQCLAFHYFKHRQCTFLATTNDNKLSLISYKLFICYMIIFLSSIQSSNTFIEITT